MHQSFAARHNLALLLSFMLAVPMLAQTSPQANLTGSVHGVVVDAYGAIIPHATVRLTAAGAAQRTLTTDSTGSYSFDGIAAGSFRLDVSATGFAAQTATDTLLPGEIHQMQPLVLGLPRTTTSITVKETERELATQQVHLDEQQRVLGVFPNFYIEYNHQAVAMDAQQKFQMAFRYNFDPVNLAGVAALAGVEQYANSYSGFGQGAEGYGKYFGAELATYTTSTFISNAALPAVLRQDPRYYYKGTGSVRSRIFYAIANTVICKGDNRRWQPNYSGLGGSLIAAGISNFYYPAANRNGAGLTFENFGISLIGSAGANLFEEFLSRRFSTGIPKGN